MKTCFRPSGPGGTAEAAAEVDVYHGAVAETEEVGSEELQEDFAPGCEGTQITI